MFSQITSEDRTVTPYKVHKRFTVNYYAGTDSATRLGVQALDAISGSLTGNPAFATSSAAYNTVITEGTTFKVFKLPLYRQLKLNFFEFQRYPNRISARNPQPQHVLDSNFLPFGHGKPSPTRTVNAGYYHWQVLKLRELHDKANVISIPQKLFGERIRTGSIELKDYSSGAGITINDDGYGNLYDAAYESNFMSASLTAQGSGSSLGVVSYDYGLLMFTHTGSYYTDIGRGEGVTGWTLKFDATKTVYEHEYLCNVKEGQFNNSTNISVSLERSGSQTIPAGMNADDLREVMNSPAESSYGSNGYTATTQTENFTTHSFFAPYVTTVGLYNDHGDLLAVAKTSRPVRNDPDLQLSFMVRFDV